MFWEAIERSVLVLLLTARLVLGTAPVHAMPMQSITENPEQSAHCHQAMDVSAAPEQHAMRHHVASAPAHLTATSDSKHDCCKQGACECPCAHVSVINLSVRSEAYRYVVSILPSVDSLGRTDPKVDRLFRPPA
jgi:hypothetical protein